MTREEAREVVEPLSDGRFAIDRPFALKVLGAFGQYLVFENEIDAVTAVMLAYRARKAGESAKVEQIRKALGID